MTKNKAKVRGFVTCQLIDTATQQVIQEETKENDVTDGFLALILGRAFSTTGQIANVLRGGNKTTTSGQYMNVLDAGSMGIYAMNNVVDVDRTDILPKYCRTADTLISNVSTYGIGGGSGSGSTLLPVDPGVAYSRTNAEGRWLTTEYSQITGTAVVRSVHFGRAHTTPDTVCGLLLGEPNPQAAWTTGTERYLLDHGTNYSKVFKYVSDTNRLTINLTDKSMSSATASVSITSPYGIFHNTGSTQAYVDNNMSGGLLRNNWAYRAKFQSATTSTVSVRVLRKSVTTITDTSTTNYITIDFPIVTDTVRNDKFVPFLVRRPDNDTIEVFLAVSYGNFSGTNGVRLMKAVIPTTALDAATDTAWQATPAIVPTQVAILTQGGIPSSIISFNYTATEPLNVFGSRDATCFNNTGYYDITTHKYWFPCFVGYDNGGIVTLGYVSPTTTVATGRFCPGFVFDSDVNWEIVDEYISFSSAIGGFCAPVLTEKGIQTIVANTSTMYYNMASQVMSGVVFDQTFEKTSERTLRIVYRFQLS